MEIINTNNLDKARKQIQEFKKQNKTIIIKAQNPEFNRKILENNSVDIFLSPELHSRRDYLKQRDSGLNEILAKLAKKNNIKIAIELKKIISLEKKQKAKILARIRQNIKICERIKTQTIILDKEKFNKKELHSFLIIMGMPTKSIKSAI